MSTSHKRYGLGSLLKSYRKTALVCGVILTWLLIASPVFAAPTIDNLTNFLRPSVAAPLAPDEEPVEVAPLAIGDTVIFGFAPAFLNKASYQSGERLVWRIVSIEKTIPVKKADAAEQEGEQEEISVPTSLTLALEPGSRYKKDEREGLGLRPVNRFETLPPIYVGYDLWKDSEIAAWLSSSAKGPNGIDYSLATGGVEGYGFLETAFNPEIVASIILPYEVPTVELPVVLPTLENLVQWEWDVSTKTITRSPATPPRLYGLMYADGQNPITVTDVGFVVPVIRIDIAPIEDPELDWFATATPRTWLDVPTIFEQPRSITLRADDLKVAHPPYLAKVSAAIETILESDEAAYNKEHLLYQWYMRIPSATDKLAVVPVDAKTGLPIDVETHQPSNEDATLIGSQINAPGRYTFFCEVIHKNGENSTSLVSVDAVISISDAQASGALPCSDCHSSNIRVLHKEVAKSLEGGYCAVCHKKAPEDWAEVDTRDDGFQTYNVSCGLSDIACHGAGDKVDGNGKAWHGTNIVGAHAVVNEIKIGNPETGKALVKDYAAIRAEQQSSPSMALNSCSGDLYRFGCHVFNSHDSRFYFGSMNLLTAHNDYAKAVAQGAALVETEALGTSGCKACHGPEIGKPLQNGEKRACTTCHKKANGSYFDAVAKAGDEKLPCYVPINVDVVAKTKEAAKAAVSAKEAASTPAQASLGIQKLVGGLLGETPKVDTLEAGVTELPDLELPRGLFPVGSLLDGTSITFK